MAGLEIYLRALRFFFGGEEGTKEGETSNNYTTILDLDTRTYGKVFIIIKNTHDTNSLDYQIIRRAYYDGLDDIWIEDTIPAGDYHTIDISKRKSARILVNVKSTTPDNPATYRIDYIAGG